MTDFKILCPTCTSILSSKKPIPNGKKITCPHCHKAFVAATADASSSAGSSSLEFDCETPAAPPAAGSRKHETPKPGEMLLTSIVKPRVTAGPRHIAVWSLVIGLVAVVGAGGGLGVYLYMKPPDTSLAHHGKDKKDGDVKTAKAETKTAAAKNQGKHQGRGDKKGSKDQEQTTDANADAAGPGAQTQNAEPKTTAVAAAAPVKPRAADWKEFKSPKGGFTVQFPAKAAEIVEREEDVIYYEAKAELNGTEYEIVFHRLKKDELGMPIKDRLNSIAAQFKEMTREKKEITIGDQPALELQMLLGDMKILAFQRWVVYKEHVFQISVAGDKEKLRPDQVARYFDSFSFVGNPQGEFIDITRETNIPKKK